MRSAHGSLYEKAASKATSAEPPPPMGNRNRTIELSTVPVRAHCPSGGRRYNTIWLRVYDPIFVVFARTCWLYEILRKTGEYFKLCCGQNRIRIRSAHGGYGQPTNFTQTGSSSGCIIIIRNRRDQNNHPAFTHETMTFPGLFNYIGIRSTDNNGCVSRASCS